MPWVPVKAKRGNGDVEPWRPNPWLFMGLGASGSGGSHTGPKTQEGQANDPCGRIGECLQSCFGRASCSERRWTTDGYCEIWFLESRPDILSRRLLEYNWKWRLKVTNHLGEIRL